MPRVYTVRPWGIAQDTEKKHAILIKIHCTNAIISEKGGNINPSICVRGEMPVVLECKLLCCGQTSGPYTSIPGIVKQIEPFLIPRYPPV